MTEQGKQIIAFIAGGIFSYITTILTVYFTWIH